MRACGGGHGSRVHLFGYLRSLARLPLCSSCLCAAAWHVTYLYSCRRTGALGGGVWLSPCLYLSLLAAAYTREYRRHTFCSLCKRACGGGHLFSATYLGYLCWCGYRCAFPIFVALRSTACNILALVSRRPVRLLLLVHVWFLLSVFVFVVLSLGCVWLPPCVLHIILSPFLSLHTILLFRGVDGLVVLAATCMYGHTFRSRKKEMGRHGGGHQRAGNPCQALHSGSMTSKHNTEAYEDKYVNLQKISVHKKV